MRRASAALAALLAGALLAGCSTVPSSSPTVQITQVAEAPDGPVGIEPVPPTAGAAPEEIVGGFIDASASLIRDHPVAREFLTEEAARSWSDSDGVTVISASYSAVPTQRGTVEVTAELVGTVDGRGVFTVADGTVFTRSFTLTDASGEWRITDPEDGLLLLLPDFQRTYDQVDAYFLDPTGTRVVPDPRFLISGQAQPNALVERLIAGPSSTTAAGVTNPLSGARLRTTVVSDGQTATVDLAGLDAASEATLAGLSGQLVWSMEQLGLRSVRVLRDGAPLGLPDVPDLQSVDDWAGLAPDVSPVEAVGHYLTGGALRRASDGQPAPGPAGAGAYGLSSAAVSADDRTGTLGLSAGVTTPTGGPATLVAGPYGGELVPVLTGGSFTAPTAAGTRPEIWTVRDGAEVVRLPSGGAPQPVSAPTLAGQGRATLLQLSPDGVRAAVVVETPQGGRLLVGTVVRSEDSVTVRDLRSITPSLTQVVDVAWRSAGTLLVLAGDPEEQRTVPYAVGVDGWGLAPVTTTGLPGQPTAIAATPGRQPLATAEGTVWLLAGGSWVTLVRGEQPLAGTAPFYPV